MKLHINNYLLFLKFRKREGIYKPEGKIRTSFQKPPSQIICAVRSIGGKKQEDAVILFKKRRVASQPDQATASLPKEWSTTPHTKPESVYLYNSIWELLSNSEWRLAVCSQHVSPQTFSREQELGRIIHIDRLHYSIPFSLGRFQLSLSTVDIGT